MKEIFEFVFLGIMFFLEGKSPWLTFKADRWHHAAQNIAVKFFNMISIYVIFFLAKYFPPINVWNFSLLEKLNLPYFLEIIVVIFICDIGTYFLHLATHQVPFLWRFHRVHHTDLFVDASTAFRTHIGETLVSNVLFLFFIFPFFGITLQQYLIYQILYALVAIFNHINLPLPDELDDFIKILIVTPNMHRIHHSDKIFETNSNYGSVFSFWDRLFKTYKVKENLKELNFGLKEFTHPRWQDFPGILITPFVSPVKD